MNILRAVLVVAFLGLADLALAQTPPPKAILSWTDNSNNEDRFNILVKVNTNPYGQLSFVAADVTTYTDTQVTVGNTYCYMVQAENTAGHANSNEACVTITSGGVVTVPVAPTLNSVIQG